MGIKKNTKCDDLTKCDALLITSLNVVSPTLFTRTAPLIKTTPPVAFSTTSDVTK